MHDASQEEAMVSNQIKMLERAHREAEDEFYSTLFDLQVLQEMDSENKRDDDIPTDQFSALKVCWSRKLCNFKPTRSYCPQ